MGTDLVTLDWPGIRRETMPTMCDAGQDTRWDEGTRVEAPHHNRMDGWMDGWEMDRWMTVCPVDTRRTRRHPINPRVQGRASWFHWIRRPPA